MMKATGANLAKITEGSVDNRSRIMIRPRDHRIRAFLRLPDGFKY